MSKFRIGETYELIHSLSGHERAYFTERVDEEADYFNLYRDLVEMEQFDAGALRKKYPNINGIASYLYESILKNMRNYRSHNFRANQIKESLIDNQFLWEKGHYEQCMNKLEKARQDAENLGDLHLLLEVNRQERHISWFQEDKKGIKEKAQNLAEESLEILEMLKEEIHYYNLYYELYTRIRKKNVLTTEEEKQELRNTFPKLLFEENQLPRSKHGQRRYFLCKAFYFRLLGEHLQAQEAFVRTLDWWKQNRAIKEEDPFWYASDLINVIQSYLTTRTFEPVEQLLRQLDKLESKNQHLHKFIFENSMLLRIVYYMNLKRYKDANKLIPRIEQGLIQYSDDPTRHLLLIYNVAVNFFLLEDYEGCANWCKKIIAIRGPFSMNQRKGSRLLYICACYELDNDEFDFRSAWKAIHVFFKRLHKKENADFELKTVEYFRMMYKALPKELDQLGKEFLGFLQSQMKDTRPSGCEELSIWVKKYVTIR